MGKVVVLLGVLFLVLAFATSTSADVDADRDALMALYISTDGAHWTRNDYWGGDDPCDPTWYGVTCTEGKVTTLDLWNNNLNGSIPAALGNLSSLVVLELDANQLTGPIPPELGNLSSLEWLNLRINQLSGPIPHQLSNLHLGWLFLHSNPDLVCWQTREALYWALTLPFYEGPRAVCPNVCLPVIMNTGG